MKALVKKYAKRGIWLEDVKKPDISENEVLIKIKKTAICGTDLHIYEWNKWAQHTIPVPMHVGHEFVGIVEKIGKNVNNFTIGERVSGEGHIVCGICRNCRTGKFHMCSNTNGVGVNRIGCFAEFLAIPASNVIKVPDNISDDLVAILDPLGNSTHTVLTYDMVGEDVLVTGAGPIGIMAAVIAKHIGARNVLITDMNEYRLNLAKKLGLENTVNIGKQLLTEKMKELNMKEGFDVALEMSGSPIALNNMIDNMKSGGSIALLGLLPEDSIVNFEKIIFKGLTLKGIYGRKMYETWYKMLAMLTSGLNVEDIITHHFSYKDYEQAFELMSKGNTGKIILDWEA